MPRIFSLLTVVGVQGKKTVNAEMEALIEEVRASRNKPSSGLLGEEDMQMRMVSRFLNETAFCLQDDIISDPVAGGALCSHLNLASLLSLFLRLFLLSPSFSFLISYDSCADIGAVFGIGFAPFRGGPFRFMDAYGVTNLVKKMEHYQSIFGPQFEPAPILKEYAKTNRKFHTQ